MKAFVTLLTIFLIGNCLSQDVSVQGTSQGKKGDLARLIVYADQFSMLEKTIAQSTCNDNGDFTLKAPMTAPDFAFLAINLDKGELYLSPGAYYKVAIAPQQSVSQGSVFDKVPLQFTLEVTGDGDLQEDVELFNQLYNSFIYNNAQAIYKSRSKQIIVDFRAEVEALFKDRKNTYLNNYIHYALISLDWLSKRMSDRQVLKNELLSRPVLYNNIQYTEFFRGFFDNYLDSFSNSHYNEVMHAINKTGDYRALKELIQRDSLLNTNDRVAELALMLLMSKSYYLPDVEKRAVIEKLKHLSTLSKFNENREIALHFIEKLTSLGYGYPAPDFSLFNGADSLVSLSDHQKRFVLINFISPDCRLCLYELDKIYKISQSFPNQLELITIVVGGDYQIVNKYKNDKGFRWNFLKVTDQMLLPEEYHVRTFPTYILVNPDGTVANATMPMPDENMEPYIERYIKRFSH